MWGLLFLGLLQEGVDGKLFARPSLLAGPHLRLGGPEVAFTSITIFAMGMNLLSMWFFTGYLHWHYAVSNIVTNFLATLWGYVPKKLFLFSGKKRKPSDVELEEVMPSFDNIEELPTPFIYEDEVTEEE